ncbi:HNH endonuclease [Coleofasciculus sp.]|uniref:HNH endonuclease n=1 Tax=Coleofasciculus sp. TaxID=3100458 RepID=UPI003A1EFE52
MRERANGLCEYCHSPEQICTTRFTIDLMLPRSLKGSDHLNNLAFACRRCNERRYNFVAGYDHITESFHRHSAFFTLLLTAQVVPLGDG